MKRARLCLGCGAPRRITKENTWLNNGLIVETKNPTRRMLFFESENIVQLFRNIEEIMELDLERIIIESQRRMTYDYVFNLVPGLVRKMVRLGGIRLLARNLIDLTRLMGYGDAAVDSVRFKGDDDDHVAVIIRNPWFLESFCGLLSGGMEAVTGLESEVNHEQIAPDTYRITTYLSSHSTEFAERLKERRRVPKEGRLELERCAGCGGPKDLEQFGWDPEKGIIETRVNKRRMVLVGPGEFEPIFDDLEEELGADVPRVVIEAQRRFVTEGFYSREDVQQEKDIIRHLALRGLGNLSEISLEKNRLRARLENPCMHLVLVGLFQGFYELIFRHQGEVEWDLLPDGDLVVDVSAEL